MRAPLLLNMVTAAFLAACGDDAAEPVGRGGSGGATSFTATVAGGGPGVGVGNTSGTGMVLEQRAYVSGTRLRARILDAGGEAKSFEGWYDAELALDCASTIVAGQVARCLPRRIEVSAWLDPACAEPVARATELGAAPPAYVVERSVGDQLCDGYRAWSVGAQQSVPALYVKDGAACVAVAGEQAVHALAPAPLEVFAELAQSDESQHGVTWRRVERGPDGAFRALSGLDKWGGEPCAFLGQTADGTSVCQPTARVRRSPTFADDACDARAVPLDPCEITGLAPIVDVSVGACGEPRTELHMAGPIVDEVFLATKDACTSAPSLGRGRRFGFLVYPYDMGWPAIQRRELPSGGPLVLSLDIVSGLPITASGSFRSADLGYAVDVLETTAGTRGVLPHVAWGSTFGDDACSVPVVAVSQTCGFIPKHASITDAAGVLTALHLIDAPHVGDVYARDANGDCAPIPRRTAPWFRLGESTALEALPPIARRVE